MKRSGMITLLMLLSIACATVIPTANSTPTIIPTATNTPTPEPITGSISGNVLDEDGSPIPLVSIITEPPTSAVTADEQGTYFILEIPPGNYIVASVKSGYTNTSVQVAVVAGRTTTADIHMTQEVASEQTLTNDLIAYYQFNGNANDESGNGYHGIVYGASLARNRFGRENRAYGFDGVNDFVQIAQNTFDGLADVTVAAWVKFDVLDSPNDDAQTIISAHKSGTNHYWTLMKGDPGERFGGQLMLIVFRPNNTYDCTILQAFPFQTDKYYHIVATKYGGLLKLFVDGVEIASKSTPCTGPIATSIGTTLIGGQDPIAGSTVNRPLDGIIDKVEIYNRTLSPSEIQALFNASK